MKTTMKRLCYGTYLILLFFISLSACNRDKTDDVSLSEHVAKYDRMQDGDLEFIRNHTAPNLPYELNMGHDAQYRYVLHKLRESGDSPKKSPALYRHLKVLRDQGNTAAPQRPADWIGEGGGLTNNDSLSNINLLDALYDDNDSSYTAVGLSSIYGGCNSTSMLFNFWTKENPTKQFGYKIFKAFNPETEYMVRRTKVRLPNDRTNESIVGEVLITPSGTQLPVIMTLEDYTKADSLCVTAPNYGIHQNPNAESCPAPGSPCVNKQTFSGPIVSCYGRNNTLPGSNGVCNYGYPIGPAGHPDSLALMISGSIFFPSKIAPIGGEIVGQVSLFLSQDDGGCILNSPDTIGAPMPSNFYIDTSDSSILRYCFNGNRFGSPTCFKSLVSSNVSLNMTVSVNLETGFSTARISSTLCDSITREWCAKIPEIFIVQGCLAKGTMITLADGGKKAVERFVGGEEVKSSGSNKIVGATTAGNEWLPMYRINTENGKSVFMSGKHAVPTDKGMTLAKDLKVGMQVTTLDGKSKIASIDMEKYDGSVHNFMVGDFDDAIAGQANVYANGILVGDLASQQYYTEKRNKAINSLDDYKKVVHQDWYVDLENWFASH